MKTFVCFGDSLTARKEGFEEPMLTTKLAKQLNQYEFINAGVSGDNTVDGLSRIEQDVIAHKPDGVTVLFGANDAAFHKSVPLDLYKKNLYKIVERISPEKTILISPAPVDEKVQKARTNEVLDQYASAAREVAEDTGCHFIDFFHQMISLEDYPIKLRGIKNDGLHFGFLSN
ncbi:GDSL-type esterase/lipase family protein [Halobacillus halophilus]|uniref:GDSL-type esterase/lipase family protein n=1 Tax=Halobacillus halophilus TaxID=1570 RepID=UPI001CB8C432|nr:GDSL-type esterase/lipase family protein [Halobacillus halophilus]